MSTSTFKGARYITKFANPITWDSTRAYEAIEAVQHNGFTYISKQPVPVGVQIDNEDFWLLWADPNAQMEQLRQLVAQYEGTVEDLSNDVENWNTTLQNEVNARENADEIINASLYGVSAYYVNDYTEKCHVVKPDSVSTIGAMAYDATNDVMYFACINTDRVTSSLLKVEAFSTKSGDVTNNGLIQLTGVQHVNSLTLYNGVLYAIDFNTGNVVAVNVNTFAITSTTTIGYRLRTGFMCDTGLYVQPYNSHRIVNYEYYSDTFNNAPGIIVGSFPAASYAVQDCNSSSGYCFRLVAKYAGSAYIEINSIYSLANIPVFIPVNISGNREFEGLTSDSNSIYVCDTQGYVFYSSEAYSIVPAVLGTRGTVSTRTNGLYNTSINGSNSALAYTYDSDTKTFSINIPSYLSTYALNAHLGVILTGFIPSMTWPDSSTHNGCLFTVPLTPARHTSVSYTSQMVSHGNGKTLLIELEITVADHVITLKISNCIMFTASGVTFYDNTNFVLNNPTASAFALVY